MITWPGGVWLIPFGPDMLGIHWLPFLVLGLVGAVVVSLVAGRHYPTNRHESIDLLERVKEGRKFEKATFLSLNILFWVVLFILLTAVVFRYVFR